MAMRRELGYDAGMSVFDALRDARARTLELTLDLDDEQWLGPRLDIVNPMRWEIGHLAWFQERWVLRHAGGESALRAGVDELYDSMRVPHDRRWDLPLLDRSATLAYASEVLERTLAATGPERAYFQWLAVFHEDMHGEAFAYTRQTLGYPAPARADGGRASESEGAKAAGPWPGDVEVPGSRYLLGAVPGRDAFVFDNEKWAHPVEVASFRIARAPVTNEELAAFVDAGGYEDRSYWSDEGWAWRTSSSATHPVYWRRAGGSLFEVRRYDRWEPLAPYRPVMHVSWFEAEAYCRWARRRLPTEAEWELAASTAEKRTFPWGEGAPDATRANLDGRVGGPVDVAAFPEGDSAFGCRQMIGNVWEWTSTRFAPYPGFVVDPYADYSEPWFHTPHMVLRGGCWATRARLLRNTWRNFYPPHRRDVLAGFRTCAVE
jgi:iron(II)-dependent oxidoreductase